MTYEFNNKKIRIPDTEIENLVKQFELRESILGEEI